MTLLHRLTHYLETKRREGEIYHQLARLGDRSLADIGLTRAEIGRFARDAAQPGVALMADAPQAGTGLLVGRALSLRAV
jgi:uncharacterized protein YjiS (DUF1127 family)